VHIKENPRNFHRFEAVWTPTILVMDGDDKERWRLEGYLPKDDFRAFLEMGLARLAFVRKDWADAEQRYAAVIEEHPNSFYAPEAVYYRGVSRYSASHDAAELANTGALLTEGYPGTEWQLRSIPWLKEKSETTSG
jgi:hypothetical protein